LHIYIYTPFNSLVPLTSPFSSCPLSESHNFLILNIKYSCFTTHPFWTMLQLRQSQFKGR
jgi:hypothetical protein